MARARGVASEAMPLAILADSWWVRHDNILVAVLSIILTGVALWVVDRWFGRTVVPATDIVTGGLSPKVDTRLRVLRRLVDLGIVVIGFGVAISQFAALNSLASTLLASTALIAAVIGFAARQPVANAVAGLVLAATQPIRVGDLVTLADQSGVVEDVRLTSTVLRTSGGAHLIVPNETFVGSVVRNDSRPETPIGPEADVWLPHGVDVAAAIEAVREDEGAVSASVRETNTEGFCLRVIAETVPAYQRAARESALRAHALDAVRRAGLLP